MSKPLKHVVIVGGGAAGWLTAGVLAAEHRCVEPGSLKVTLIESPDVKTIGVGEGTWPSMRDTLRKMGVSETELFRQCDASFKQGSRFFGWVDGSDEDVYDHPFALPAGFGEANLVSQWQEKHADIPFAGLVSYQPYLCDRGLAPKQKTTPEWAAVANYAYHLDAGKFGRFLQEYCTGRLGVKHILDHVQGVQAADNDDIAALKTTQNGLLEADLFIDCTGFASLLLGQHYQVPLISCRDSLFCDTAMAIQVPYAEENTPIASNTRSTAQTAGWIWDIGLPQRRGVGHVYSSAHCDDDQAEKSLRDYVTASGGDGHSASVRKLPLNPGYRKSFWHKNCVAVGISAGFVEPLEASALAMIEFSAAMISNELPANRNMMEVTAKRFNQRFTYRWERIVDFLKLHYVLSQRDDSDFWRDNRREQSLSPRLQELVGLWKYQPPSRSDFYQIEEIFPSASFQYVLYGMGFVPEPRTHRRSDGPDLAEQFFSDNANLTAKFLAGLPSNREMIEHVIKHGMQKI